MHSLSTPNDCQAAKSGYINAPSPVNNTPCNVRTPRNIDLNPRNMHVFASNSSKFHSNEAHQATMKTCKWIVFLGA